MMAKDPGTCCSFRISTFVRMNSLSGVNPSGPLMTRLTPASAMDGTRRIAPSMISSKRGMSGPESSFLATASQSRIEASRESSPPVTCGTTRSKLAISSRPKSSAFPLTD